MKNPADELALPVARHLPGVNRRPAAHWLDAIARFPAEPVTDANAASHLAWRYGLRLIDEGYYWEAHEVLEPAWWHAAANSPQRHLVQATIHLANGALKRCLNRQRAALRLAELATRSAERAYAARPRRLLGLSQAQVTMAAASISSTDDRLVLQPDFAL